MDLLILIGIIVSIWCLGMLWQFLKTLIENRALRFYEREAKLAKEKANIEAMVRQTSIDRKAIDILASEKSKGFPWLAQAYGDYFHLRDMKEADMLENKAHPAKVSADKVREIASKRRNATQKLKIAQGIIDYYHELFPFLEDFLGDIDDVTLKKVMARDLEAPIRDIGEMGIDPVKIYLSSLSDEEYSHLSSAERNQRALDVYWNKSKKSNWQIGKDYERFIGYLYEIKGYSVYYQGILEGYEDLGRDLICKKGGDVVIVQCKHWARHKTIHEKHINQLYGTVVKYMIDHPEDKVGALLYTSAMLSERAKEFARYLGIGILEGFALNPYPSIKCNVSRKNGEKIYHLPFDQQYDRTLIEEERNEKYVETTYEAESLGFRRAWKWKGEPAGE